MHERKTISVHTSDLLLPSFRQSLILIDVCSMGLLKRVPTLTSH